MSDNDLIQKGQNDLIRRGDVLAEVDGAGYVRVEDILALPAVTPTPRCGIRAGMTKFPHAPKTVRLTPNGGLPTGNWKDHELVEYIRADMIPAYQKTLETNKETV